MYYYKMTVGNYLNQNKHQSTLIRKKYRKSPPYRCCAAPDHNVNKVNHGYCCTYPNLWRRLELKIEYRTYTSDGGI